MQKILAKEDDQSKKWKKLVLCQIFHYDCIDIELRKQAQKELIDLMKQSNLHVQILEYMERFTLYEGYLNDKENSYVHVMQLYKDNSKFLREIFQTRCREPLFVVFLKGLQKLPSESDRKIVEKRRDKIRKIGENICE